MASYAAARSVFRSCSGRSSAFRLPSAVKAARSPFHLTSSKAISHRTFRCSAPLSACLESMLPYHSVTASALMTSMLSISQRSFGWLPDGQEKTK